MLTLFKRLWVPLVVAAAAVAGTVAVVNLRDAFGADEIFGWSGRGSEIIESINEKHITYEVFRDMGLAFAVVMGLIYLLTVGWFGSYTVPIAIMAPIPLSLIGIVPAHAMAGAFFESFVVAEVLKSYANSGVLDPPLYFYRDKEQNEIDLLILRGQTLYPLEIKKHADPKLDDVKAFAVLDTIPGVIRGPGGLICLYDRPVPLKGKDMVIPLSYI